MGKNDSIKSLEPGWQTASMLEQSEGGNRKTWDRDIRALAEEMVTRAVAEQKIGEPEARQYVDRRYAGMRKSGGGRSAMAASPEGLQILKDRDEEISRWKTLDMLAQSGEWSRDTWKHRIRWLRRALTEDIAAAGGMSPEDAEEIVSTRFIRLDNIRGKQSSTVWIVSPEAERILQDLKENPLPTDSDRGWKSGSNLFEEHGGSPKTWDIRIRKLRDRLAGDILATGFAKETGEAEEIVENHLVGMRKPARGPSAMAVSPDAERILQDLKENPPPTDFDRGWTNASMLRETMGGLGKLWNSIIHELREEMVKRTMDEKQMDEAEAREHVDRHHVGMRQRAHGRPHMAVSPQMAEIVKARYQEKYPSRPPGRPREYGQDEPKKIKTRQELHSEAAEQSSGNPGVETGNSVDRRVSSVLERLKLRHDPKGKTPSR